MKTWIFGLVISGLVCAWPRPVSAAISADEATVSELQRLQQDLERLDDELSALDESSPAESRRLRQRSEEIRDDAVYLKVKMRRHQGDAATGTGVLRSEVQDLRRDIARLRGEIDTTSAEPRASGEVRIPAGTELSLRLEDSLSSETANLEDTFNASVQQAVRIDGRTAIPAGAEVRGIVRGVESARRLQKPGRLELDFDTLHIDSARLDLRTSVVAMQDEDAAGDRNRKAGIGAVLGGVIGGLLKGRTGAVIGVLAGGGVVVAQKGEDVELPAGTILKVRLERPLTIR